MGSGHTPTADEVSVLKHELVELFDHIQKIRKEIAAIRRPGADDDRFLQMADELDAIVSATEDATNQIMENTEAVEEIVQQVRGKTDNPEIQALLDQVPIKTSDIFQACSFQDITGQRITKVVKLQQFIEERVNNLIAVWGEDKIASEGVDIDDPDSKDPYKRYLNGPQFAGEGVSQDEVDAMLAGGAALPEKEKKKHVAPKPSVAGTTSADDAKKKDEAPAEDAPKLDQSAIDDLFP